MIIRYLLDNLPGSQIVVLAIIPRNTPTCGCYLQPSIFTDSITAVNNQLK